MINQILRQEFYNLKAEVLKRMKSGSFLYIYQNTEKGEGITLSDDDLLMNKLYPMMGTPPVPCDADALIDAYKIHIRKDLTEDQYVQMAIDRFKIIIIELDKKQTK